ncbi:MAG: sugar ABC transporter permease [Clostridia bacterium]|nr:sugar ABC transporter permease [Clostridia bacterium]
MAEAVNNDALNPAEENSEANAPKKVKKIKPEKVKAKKEKSTKKSEPSDNSKKKNRKRMSYERKQSFVGFMFTLPWLIGFLMFFFIPAIKSINFSLSDVKIFEDYATEWNNFQNYSNIFKDATFLRNLSSTFGDLAINVPIILVFSLFVAVLLNRKFIGRGIARAVFFLPVIVTTGVVMTAFNGASDTSAVFEGDVSNGIMFSTMNATEVLGSLGLGEQITGYMIAISDRIFDVVWDSGIQIILFLAALQSISPALYEACDVEGATAWEKFWLITFPSVSPIILVNIVYTIVDTFSDPSNAVLSQVDALVTTTFNYGNAAAIVWVYFAIVLVIIGAVFLVCKRLIFYSVD